MLELRSYHQEVGVYVYLAAVVVQSLEAGLEADTPGDAPDGRGRGPPQARGQGRGARTCAARPRRTPPCTQCPPPAYTESHI